MHNIAKNDKSDQVYIITSVSEPTVGRRRKRYLQLMAIRVMLVPGIFLFDLPVWVQAGVVLVAAISQFAAVIGANTPDYNQSTNPSKLHTKTQSVLDGKVNL